MNDQLEADFERALADFEAGDFTHVEAACRKMLVDAPEDADIHHLLGVALLQAGRAGEALEALQRAGELAPEGAEIFGNLAIACEAAGDFESAGNAYRRAIDLGERDPELLYGAALAAKLMGRPDEAVAGAEGLVRACPDHGPGWHLLAVSRMETGDPAAAAEAFESLLALEPENAEVRGNYAVVLAKLGRRREARAAFECATADAAATADCLLNYGMMLEEDNENAAALVAYRRAAERDEESPLICEAFAKLAGRCNEDALVTAHLNDLVSRRPALDFAWFYLAAAQIGAGDRQAAEDSMTRYLELDPEDRLGGRLLLGAEGPSEAYLRNFYRVRAGDWDRTVTEAYHGHDLVVAAFEAYVVDCGAPEHALDAGCGSGSLAVKLKPSVGRLDGVDISPEMIAEAGRKGVYETLETGDLFDFLKARPGRYDLIVAAAVLFHFRDLAASLTPIAGGLKDGGQAIFTVFKSAEGSLRLNDQGFFEHGRDEIETALDMAGLDPVAIQEAIHEYDSDDTPRPCFCVRCARSGAS